MLPQRTGPVVMKHSVFDQKTTGGDHVLRDGWCGLLAIYSPSCTILRSYLTTPSSLYVFRTKLLQIPALPTSSITHECRFPAKETWELFITTICLPTFFIWANKRARVLKVQDLSRKSNFLNFERTAKGLMQ